MIKQENRKCGLDIKCFSCVLRLGIQTCLDEHTKKMKICERKQMTRDFYHKKQKKDVSAWCRFVFSVSLIKTQKNDEECRKHMWSCRRKGHRKDHLQNLKKQPQLVLQGSSFVYTKRSRRKPMREKADTSPSSLYFASWNTFDKLHFHAKFASHMRN